MDKIFYNEAASVKLGWEPEWFGATEIDEVLVRNVKKFQKEHGLTADGLVGPTTFRRVWTQRESEIEKYQPSTLSAADGGFILYNNDYHEIKGNKVVLPFNRGGKKFSKGYKRVMTKRKPNMFVTHWDVCLSADSCFRVLERRGLSIHFTIDNDGTIHQYLDLNHIAYHAGSSKWNKASIGVEISNAYYPKYQKWYESNVGKPRPVVEGAKVHNRSMETHLGFYPEQLAALKALYRAIHEATGIPYATPSTNTVSRPCVLGSYKGYIHHYNLTRNKIDCGGLDIAAIMEELKNER